MSKVQISVREPFTLNIEGTHTAFPRGLHVVDASVANHWYTQAHADVVGEVEETTASKPASANATAASTNNGRRAGATASKPASANA